MNERTKEVHIGHDSSNLSVVTVTLETANISASLSSSGFTVRDIPKGEYDLEDEYPNL